MSSIIMQNVCTLFLICFICITEKMKTIEKTINYLMNKLNWINLLTKKILYFNTALINVTMFQHPVCRHCQLYSSRCRVHGTRARQDAQRTLRAIWPTRWGEWSIFVLVYFNLCFSHSESFSGAIFTHAKIVNTGPRYVVCLFL